MVAKIISGKSLNGALNYNEKKVAQGKADLIWQSGFHKDIHQLDFYDKLFRLKDLAIRNERTKTNTVHISLNFAVGEKLHGEKLNEIATTYMENIGFGNQPYLVYLHRDAGHPHVHIVSTNIMASGERISLHNLGRTKSEVARKLVEQQFGLVRAEKKESQSQDLPSLAKIEYGKVDTKRAMSNVVRIITIQYKFTSVAELNAVLRQFNVVADRGSKKSRMYSKNGLIYWALDAKGNKVGVPIKASSIYGSPTLKNLELKFEVNYKKRMEHREQLKHSIDHVMKVRSSSIGFTQALKAKGIDVVLRTNQQGRLYGVTFIDHRSKVVFNGSDLGKAYSAAALSSWFIKSQSAQTKTNSATKPLLKWENTGINNQGEISTGRSLLDELLNPDLQEGQTPLGMAQNKRKKKRKKII